MRRTCDSSASPGGPEDCPSPRLGTSRRLRPLASTAQLRPALGPRRSPPPSRPSGPCEPRLRGRRLARAPARVRALASAARARGPASPAPRSRACSRVRWSGSGGSFARVCSRARARPASAALRLCARSSRGAAVARGSSRTAPSSSPANGLSRSTSTTSRPATSASRVRAVVCRRDRPAPWRRCDGPERRSSRPRPRERRRSQPGPHLPAVRGTPGRCSGGLLPRPSVCAARRLRACFEGGDLRVPGCRRATWLRAHAVRDGLLAAGHETSTPTASPAARKAVSELSTLGARSHRTARRKADRAPPRHPPAGSRASRRVFDAIAWT